MSIKSTVFTSTISVTLKLPKSEDIIPYINIQLYMLIIFVTIIYIIIT